MAVIAHRALGENLKAFFIDDFFRKKDEYEFVKDTFSKIGIKVELCDIKEKMLKALEGVSSNIEKRIIFRKVFYEAFGEKIRETQARFFFQGTNKADKIMFEKGQEQHNVGVQFIDYGIINVIEPLENFYKHEIREIARLLGLPEEIYKRQPFPGPGLVIRCLGEITKEKIEIIREALAIVESEISYLEPFQVIVAISGDLVASMRNRSVPDKYIILVRAVKSKDAMTAEAIIPSKGIKSKVEERLMSISEKIGRVVWDTTDKPPATIEYI